MNYIIRHIYEETRDGLWLLTEKTIARRNETEVKAQFHNMRIGEIRELGANFEIVRVD